jgi:hypothetical protein
MAKKDLELHWLERAREIRPDLFCGDLNANESPDFLLVHEARVLGIEVTQFVYPRNEGEPIPEEQAGLRHSVLARARREFAQMSAARLRVGVVFKPKVALTAPRARELATQLARWLSDNVRDAADTVQQRWTESIPPELSSIHTSVVSSAATAHWYPAQAGWYSTADSEAVADVAAAKEARIAEYRTKCAELALLIVFDGEPRWGRIVHAPPHIPRFSVVSSFDFVYCLDVFEKRLVEISVSGPSNMDRN